MGQAAFLMKNPLAVERIFYDSVPGKLGYARTCICMFNIWVYDIIKLLICNTGPLFWPVFVIATLAAMIASQAMISATFSCIKQAMALGCFPRIKIIHTSKKVMGQIYIPVMNWFLMVMCIIIVATFRSTNDIANAYGQYCDLHVL
jgi:KUP system potassium uptake protein